MNKATYSNKMTRSDKRMERGEYLCRTKEFAKRGQELPHTKLLDLDVVTIRSAAKQRENLRKYIKENLSNDALAVKFGVHVRTIEKIMQFESWSHV